MEREFVPYELAIKLKELGFNERCFGYYYTLNGKDWKFAEKTEFYRLDDEISIGGKFSLLAPTFSQCFRWFRDMHNMFHEIQIDRTTQPKFCYAVFHYEHYGNYEGIGIEDWSLYRTYEEAELACLDKLIEVVESKSE